MEPQLVVDLVLGVLVVEALAIAVAGARIPALPPFRTLWPNLAAGLLLVLALRSAVAGNTMLIAPLLALAGAAHVADLFMRRRR